jgi:PKD repeat protein
MKKTLLAILLIAFGSTITKAQSCQAGFVSSPSQLYLSGINFHNTSTSTAVPGQYVNYSWTFGDGVSQQGGTSPTHYYSQLGTYSVCLTVTVFDSINNVTLCTDTYCDSVVLNSACINNINIQGNWATPSSFDFSTYAISNFNYQSIAYSWDFGDGNSSTQSNPSHTYASSGTYGVCLTVDFKDAMGNTVCSATDCDTVFVDSMIKCDAGFNQYQDQYTQHTINFNQTSLSLPHSYSIYTWDFGDGASGVGPNVTHTYNQEGTYVVCIQRQVTDSITGISCNSMFCDSVVVDSINLIYVPFCNAQFKVDSANSSSSNIVIINNSTPSNGSQYQTTYLWDFGDGSTSNQQYPTHNYANQGLYNVCLTITSINQTLDTCIDTYCRVMGVDSLGNMYFKNGTGFTLNVVAPNIGLSDYLEPSTSLYPNPAKSYITLDLGSAAIESDTRWYLYDLNGKLLRTDSIKQAETDINLLDMKSGTYIIHVKSETKVSTHKIQLLR